MVVVRDLVAICVTAIGFGAIMARGLNAITAGAAIPIALGYAVVIAFPAALIARAMGQRGILRAIAWGAGVSSPAGIFALSAGLKGLLFAIVAGAVGGAVSWALVKAQGLPSLLAPKRLKLPIGYVVTVALGSVALAGLADYVRPRPAIRQLGAVEVLVENSVDRTALVELLQREAALDGEMHVDDVTERWRELYEDDARDGHPMPIELRSTIDVGVWRGKNDDEQVASVDDRGHLGRAWVMFYEGKNPEKSAKAQASITAAIKRRWPEARYVPITPNGGFPSASDLVWTGHSYVLKPDAAARYAARSKPR